MEQVVDNVGKVRAMMIRDYFRGPCKAVSVEEKASILLIMLKFILTTNDSFNYHQQLEKPWIEQLHRKHANINQVISTIFYYFFL